MLDNFFEIFLYSVLMGCITAFPAAFIFNYVWRLVYVSTNKTKIVRKAVENNHKVQGKLIDAREQLGDQDIPVPNGKWYSVYRFEYMGKTYQYEGVIAGYPPDELNLYFESDPNKCCTLNELGYHETKWMKYYRPMFVICFLIFFIYEMFK